MSFKDEAEFENTFIDLLVTEKGWKDGVIRYPTEKELIKNWADILFDNNRSADRLGDHPLTDGEMKQILDQIAVLASPLNLNGFINGGIVQIIRDNESDTHNFKKMISLKIFDKNEIAAGRTRYQIAQQPKFNPKSNIYPSRRGDFCLLINGMPVIHVELKKSGVPISDAQYQIQKYLHEGVFTGLFSLVQVFVAMNPEECTYFANPGSDDKFNEKLCFHWADNHNNRIDKWNEIAERLLSIPMAHEMIGFYTVADKTNNNLKVMRSYQYYAASAISHRISKMKWDDQSIYGGYVWHTTGSGKTMTSFKAAQLIANSRDADKVVFLMDRIELSTQSYKEYRGFSDETDDVQKTENTDVLITKLKSKEASNTLIVTSIQKMSRIRDDMTNSADIEKINKKRIVFIVDECHRSVFGDMLSIIKFTFPHAVFIGFSGTPILSVNKKKDSTTADVFGDELQGTRYTIADGLRDGNVLGFDCIPQPTYDDDTLREAVALDKAKANSVKEALSDENKKIVYLHWMNDVPMGEELDDDGNSLESIEGQLYDTQYNRDEHRAAVINDLLKQWDKQSQCGKFHAILATSSIPEAIRYYKMLKSRNTSLRFTAVFDSSDSNNAFSIEKIDGITEILEDYKTTFGKAFSIPQYTAFKRDVCSRLSHKIPYFAIENQPDECLDLLIVVDQMLTGFDSKWINALYMDKFYKRKNIEMIVQAFSRTNRVFGNDKPHGTIRYYRRPYTMQKIIEYAFESYSGSKPRGLFVAKLYDNLIGMNKAFTEIDELFQLSNIQNFSKLPDDPNEKKEFAKLFRRLNKHLEPAKIQGFIWINLSYKFDEGDVNVLFDENAYNTLLIRYKELRKVRDDSADQIPYDIDPYLMKLPTDKIDSTYMDALLAKYQKLMENNVDKSVQDEILNTLHKSFSSLSQEQQKYANIVLKEIQNKQLIVEDGKSFLDYVNQYQSKAKTTQIAIFAKRFGFDEKLLSAIMRRPVSEENINEFGRYDNLIESVDIGIAQQYFETKSGASIPKRKIRTQLDKMLREFILSGGFDIE